MSKTESTGRKIVEYGINDRPPLIRALPLGLQHVLAMFLGNVAPPLIIASEMGLEAATTSFLVQSALIIAGVATIVQAYPIGPVGAGLPIVMGTSFVGVMVLSSIGQVYGLSAIFGACLVCSFVEVGLGSVIKKIQFLFPPLVSGLVVMLIGLTLIPLGVSYAAGGPTADNFGAPRNLLLAAGVLIVTLIMNQFFRGIGRILSVLVGIVVGYLAAIPLGMVDFSRVAAAGWVTWPRPVEFGLSFHWEAIAAVFVLYLITTVETVGDISGTTAVEGREPTGEELRGGLIADGVMSGVAALFNAFPNTSFSQNVGLINFTGVASRFVAAIGGIFLVLFGLIPKVGELVAEMPEPVLGGGGLVMFAMIFASGLKIISENVEMTQRNLAVIAVSVGLGLGVKVHPEVLNFIPGNFDNFLQDGLIIGALTALILNLVFPVSETKNNTSQPT